MCAINRQAPLIVGISSQCCFRYAEKYRNMIITSFQCLVDLVQLLNNHRTGSATAVADGSDAVFTGLQLVQEGD